MDQTKKYDEKRVGGIIHRNGFDFQRIGADELMVSSSEGEMWITPEILGQILISREWSDPVFQQLSNDRINEFIQGFFHFFDYEEHGIPSYGSPVNPNVPCERIDVKPSKLYIMSKFYKPICRSEMSSQQLAEQLHKLIQKAADPLEAGKIIALELANNDISCQLDAQAAILSQEFKEKNYWGKNKSRSTFLTSETNLPDCKLEQIVCDLLKLLFSGRAFFSVGMKLRPDELPDDYGFVTFTNISGHRISNLNNIAGHHDIGGNTNYLRIIFRFMNKIRPGHPELPNQQLIITTILPQNPISPGLALSILPYGYKSDYFINGTAIGPFESKNLYDDRIPPVSPAPAPVHFTLTAPVHFTLTAPVHFTLTSPVHFDLTAPVDDHDLVHVPSPDVLVNNSPPVVSKHWYNYIAFWKWLF